MENKENIERLIQSRLDRKNDIPVPLRRIDTLTKLCGASSQCVATAIIDGKLYFTANEIYKTSRDDNPTYILINKVSKYFSRLANGKPNLAKEREEVFREICIAKAKKDSQGNIPYPPALPGRVVDLIMKGTRLVSSYKTHYHEVTLLLKAKFEDLYKDFQLLEEAIQNKSKENARRAPAEASSSSVPMSEDDNIINDDFFEILRLNKIEVLKEEPSTATLTAKADRKKVHTLVAASKVKSSSAAAGEEEKPEPSSNTASAAISAKKKSAGIKEKAATEEGAKKLVVHAEMKLLSFLITNIDSLIKKVLKEEKIVIYVSISRLCCLKCHSMLEAAQKVFQDKQVPVEIIFRGQHDLDFSNWCAPKIFYKSYLTMKTSEENPSLAESIAVEGRLKLENYPKEDPRKDHTYMELSPSSRSETGSLDPIVAKQAFLHRVAQMLKRFDPQTKLEEIIQLTEIASILHSTETYKILFDNKLDPKNIEEIKRNYLFIEKELNTMTSGRSRYIEGNLLKILQDPELTDKKIAHYFQHFKLLPVVDKSVQLGAYPASSSSKSTSHSESSPSGPASNLSSQNPGEGRLMLPGFQAKVAANPSVSETVGEAPGISLQKQSSSPAPAKKRKKESPGSGQAGKAP